MFAIAMVKVRVAAGSSTAAAKPFTDLLDRYEERFGEQGLRVLAAHLVELAAGLAGGRLAAIEHLQRIEMETLTRQQQPGR